jgi:hypothetical protein
MLRELVIAFLLPLTFIPYIDRVVEDMRVKARWKPKFKELEEQFNTWEKEGKASRTIEKEEE